MNGHNPGSALASPTTDSLAISLLRPIIFLPYLRSVKVEDNLANRRALSEIVRDSQSSAIVATILVGPM
jgi:hypothetical protein